VPVIAAGAAQAALQEETRIAKIQAVVRGRSARKANRFSKYATSTVDAVVHAVEDAVHAVEGAVVGASHAVQSVLATHAATDSEVNAPTPADRWFTPRDGWRATNGKGAVPHTLMPTAATAEHLFPLESDVIGELKLEVLEAQDLPNMDTTFGLSLGNLTDTYALVVFEGAASRTSVVRQSLNPRWPADDPNVQHGSLD
jgi:hypothetical protein